MEIIIKLYRNNTEWLAGHACDKAVWDTFEGAHSSVERWLSYNPDGVAERHICEHTTIKIWRAGDDFGTV